MRHKIGEKNMQTDRTKGPRSRTHFPVSDVFKADRWRQKLFTESSTFNESSIGMLMKPK